MNVVKSSLVAAVAVVGLQATVAHAATLNLVMNDNFGSDDITIDVTIEEMSGDLKFTLAVDSSGGKNIGDLRGYFFDIANFDVNDNYVATGADITDQDTNTNNLGGGNNVNPRGPYSFGVEIGTSGIGGDDIQTTMFVLSADIALSMNSLMGQDMAGRATSVGPVNSDRIGSSKVGLGVPEVPVPAAGFLLVGGLGALGLVRRRRKA